MTRSIFSKHTLITFVAAIIATGAMAWTMHRDSQAQRNGVKDTGRLLTAAQLPIDSVTRITLKRHDEHALVFERAANPAGAAGPQWNQIEPFPYPVETFSIRQFITLARELNVLDSLNLIDIVSRNGNGATLATLELQPPAAEVTYQWPDGGSLTLQLGRRTVAGRAYLRKAGDEKIYLVDSKLHDRAIEDDPKEWRDRTIFHNVNIDATRLAWEQGEGSQKSKMVLVRDRKQWKMLEPVQTRVDPVSRDAYFQSLERAVVGGFILDQPSPEEFSKFGLASPVASLTLSVPAPGVGGTASSASDESTAGPTETQRLVIGSRVGSATQDRFGMVEGRPVIVRIPEAALGQLFRQPKDVADPVASRVSPADVKSIVIRHAKPKDELKLQRDLETWHAPERNNVEVNGAYIQELLDQLTKLRATAIDFKTYPQELEVAIVTLYGYDGKAIDTVRIAKETDTGRWAFENGDNVLRIHQPGMKMRLTAEDFGL